MLHILGASPEAAAYAVYSLGEPDVLKSPVVTEHIQRSYLQQYEDSCIDQMVYYVAFTQGLIS